MKFLDQAMLLGWLGNDHATVEIPWPETMTRQLPDIKYC